MAALILSKNKQRWPLADVAAELVPLDLALGWGLMSTPQEIAKLRIWQWGRSFYWRVRGGERFNPGDAIPLAANINLIPADDTVRRALMRAREGDLIRLEERLVDAHHPDMGWWRSSRTRAETGDRTSEILLMERVVPRSGLGPE